MKKNNIHKLVISALMAALVCLSTMIVLTYSPAGGYVNLGDCFVLISGYILGPLWGGIAAAIGAGLTDLILGAATYIPATFVIKWGVAALASVLFGLLGRGRRHKLPFYAISGLCGEILMVVGYFLYETVLYGAAGALSGVVGNLVQGAFGTVLSSVLMLPLAKIPYLRSFSDRL